MRAPLLAQVALGVTAVLALGCSRGERQDARTEEATPASGAPRATPDATSEVVEGTLLVDGSSVGPLRCRPGANVHIFVDIVSPAGVLRFEDQRMSWDGEPLTCARLDRSWGGGRRPDNSAYWRGTLDFACRAGARTYAGQLRLDCGDITTEERAQLDAQRAKIRARQSADPAPP